MRKHPALSVSRAIAVRMARTAVHAAGAPSFAVAALACAVSSAIADDLYVNDFATRTSKEPIPAYGVARTAQPYPAKSAYLRYWVTPANAPYSASSPMSSFYVSEANSGDGRPNVDGWFTPNIGAYTHAPYYWYPFEGSLSQSPVLSWTTTQGSSTVGVALHPIHNEITNGLLRFQIDVKVAEKWVRTDGNSYLKIFPVFRKYLNILDWGVGQPGGEAPGKFGVRSESKTKTTCSFPMLYNTDGGTAKGNNYSGSFSDDGSDGKTNYWFRFVATYDLDNGKYSGEVFRFSKAKGHPTFDDLPSDLNAYQSWTDISAPNPVTAESGGIAGIGFYAGGIYKNADASSAAGKPFVDNIRLSWKAPDASDFEVFYENDFSTRWYKTLCAPSRAATGAYSQSTETEDVADTFSGYETGTANQIIVGQQNTTAPNPIGFDGWRRMPYYGSMHGRPAIFAYGGNATYDAGGTGGNMLSFGDQSGACRIMQTLCTSFSSGTVRMAADIWLPRGANLKEQKFTRRAGFGLGSASLYGAARSEVPGNLAAGFGYERLADAGASSHKPYTIASGGSGTEPARVFPASYTAPESNCWFRVEVSADLDTRKYGVTVTPIGAASVTASDTPSDPAIFSETGLDFASDVSDIGSFYLLGYG